MTLKGVWLRVLLAQATWHRLRREGSATRRELEAQSPAQLGRIQPEAPLTDQPLIHQGLEPVEHIWLFQLLQGQPGFIPHR